MTTAPTVDLSNHFLQELQTVNEDVRRLAALATFYRLRPSNSVTVEQFISELQGHQELWSAVRSLGIVEFAEALAGHHAPIATKPQRRPRLTEEQKISLAATILRVLAGHPPGMSRTELTTAIITTGLTPVGIKRTDLPIKVRQPLHELLAAGKLHTVGEKRLMKYVLGSREMKS